MGKLVVINAPRSFTTIWSVVKQLMNERTVRKVEILGNNYSGTLLSLIPEENLPVNFGGKCECRGGCHLSSAGPWMEGRQERRKQWLRGERPLPRIEWAGPDTDEGNRLTFYDIGSVRLEEEELQNLEGAASTKPERTPAVFVAA